MRESMLEYGTDKPDLRNPLIIHDVTEHFAQSGFGLFEKIVGGGGVVRADPGAGHRRQEPQVLRRHERLGAQRRPCRARLCHPQGRRIRRPDRQEPRRGRHGRAVRRAGPWPRRRLLLRRRQGSAGRQAGRRCAHPRRRAARPDRARTPSSFCWIVDFPISNRTRTHKKVDFSHNPFSMPQGGMEALETQDPLTIKAYQYDIVCNGV